MASKLFDRETRERAWLLYAWCRRCDDLADGQMLGHGTFQVQDAHALVRDLHAKTGAALCGDETGDANFDALGVVAKERDIPHGLVWDHIVGFTLDAYGSAPETEGDLLTYCHHVAGVVGQMMAIVMGVSPDNKKALTRADDLGIAFQLANIARDVAEDAANGRCYLPREWLDEAGVPPETMTAHENRVRLVPLIERLCALSRRYEASGRAGAAALGFRPAWAVLAAAGVYGGIARKVAADPERALERRTVTSRGEKLRALASALGQALRR